MGHEVYICYSDEDKLTAEAICHIFEENRFKCWLNSRDLPKHYDVEDISNAIRASKLMVLVFSNYSKTSNYVHSEVDIAFSQNIPILVFSVDDSKLDGSLEFFLGGQHWLDAYPNPSIEFENLIYEASKILDKPVQKPILDEKVVKKASKNIIGRTAGSGKSYFKTLLKILVITPVILFVLSILIVPFGRSLNYSVGMFLFASPLIFWPIALILYIFQKLYTSF